MNSKFFRALIPREINFAVDDKGTALKIEKQKRPETPSCFFTSTSHSRCFSGTDVGRVIIQTTYNSNFCPQNPIAMKKITPFALLQILFFCRTVAL
jgi:hypothetical protein